MKKSEIISYIHQIIFEKKEAIQKRFKDLSTDLTSEHKSSAGDKHETGRAMIQLEQEKLSNQLSQYSQHYETISKLNLESTDSVQLGSIVKTLNGTYFLSIGLGKVNIGAETLFCISTSSPIGQLMLNLRVNDHYTFNGITNQVLEII